MGYSATRIVNTAIDTVNEKYGKVWYRRYNRFQDDGYKYNVGFYHDGIWSFDCLGFVHTMVNGFKGDSAQLGGGAVMDNFVNMSDENTTLYSYCSVRGTFPKTDCKPASLLKMDGHVGLFIGERSENGQIINSAEVTCSMGGGGKFSWVDLNNGNRYSCKGGTYLGTWDYWGEFDRVDYDYNHSSTMVVDNTSSTTVTSGNKNKKGIDVCYHQGDIDFNKVKRSGYDFVIIRDGWGEKDIDPKLITYAKDAIKAGIEVAGVYHFIYAANTTQVIQNAQQAIENVKKAGLPKTTVIWCDLEYDTVDNARDYRNTVLTASMQKEFVETFCNYILAEGYPTGAYVNQDYLDRVLGKDFGKHYDLWLADLEGNAYTKCVYRQVGWYDKVSGINGNVDTNEYYGQYTAGTAKPKTIPTTNNQSTTNTKTSDTVQSIAKNFQVVKYGTTGEIVKVLQTILKNIGYYNGDVDGHAGNLTVNAIKTFQSYNGIGADGVFGVKSWTALLTKYADDFIKVMPVVTKNSKGEVVKMLQRELKRLGYYNDAIDGHAGNNTYSAIKKIQTDWNAKDKAILVDGFFGNQCWTKIIKG